MPAKFGAVRQSVNRPGFRFQGIAQRAPTYSYKQRNPNNEIAWLWHALPQHRTTQHALRFQLLSACRIGEVVGLRWEHISTDAVRWPMTKNGKRHSLPLMSAFKSILAAQRGLDDEHVFPITTTTVQRHLLAVAQRRDLRTHDLRRTAATTLLELVVDGLHIDQILNHRPKKLNRSYFAGEFLEAKASALGPTLV